MQTTERPGTGARHYSHEELIGYIRQKVDQLLEVMGTQSLQHHELDDSTLLDFDPIGIVAESFRHVLEHFQETNEELAIAKNELHAILNAAGAAIVVLDQEFRVDAANDQARQMLLGSEESADGVALCDYIKRECGEFKELIRRKSRNRERFVERTEVTVNDRQFEIVATPLSEQHDESNRLILIFIDITSRKWAEEKLRQAATVFDTTADAIVITDRYNDIIAVNRAFTYITGYEEREVLGKNPRVLSSGRHSKAFFERLWKSLHETGRWQGEIWDKRKDGEEFPAWQTINAIREQDGSTASYVSILSDISAYKDSQEKLNFLAHHDPLTRLPNRILFNDRLEHALEVCRRDGMALALIFLDLDRFKYINDSLGHPIGDALLVQVAQRLRYGISSVDTVARLGGDEFVILLEQLGRPEDAAKQCEKLQEAFSSPFLVEGHELQSSLSMGISVFPRDGEDAATLLKNADAAMYRAKEEGRNGFRFFTNELWVSAVERLTLEGALRRAVERNQLELHYQPQYSLTDGRIVAAEALIRWDHPEMGLLSPDTFIPIAEESGLIVRIGEWVLEQACLAMRRWQDRGYPIERVAVNVSGVQLQRHEMSRTVKRILSESRLSPQALELEITESVIMQRPEEANAALHKLRALGVCVAIDDFGTGYSSLGQLKTLSLDRIKIDRAFIRDVATNRADAAIVRAIVALGRAIDLEVVAEGVEEENQHRFLREAGCDSTQGYFYSKPLPLHQLEVLLSRHAVASA